MFYPVGQTAPQLEGTAYIADGARIIGGVHLGAEANICTTPSCVRTTHPSWSAPAPTCRTAASSTPTAASPAGSGRASRWGMAPFCTPAQWKTTAPSAWGAIVLNGAVIGENSIVGAGALVTKNTVVPPAA